MKQWKIVTFLFLANLTAPAMSQSAPQNIHSDGEIRLQANGNLQSWDSTLTKWVQPKQFWLNYANRTGGLTWGKRSDYPPYEKVNEYDSLIIEQENDSCMMTFFHTRWRRANDVWRWDDQFNEYSACPDVFK